MLLENRVAIVTGGSRGTGASIARRFADEGAQVYIADVRTDEGAAVASGIGDAATFVATDVTSEPDWAALVDQVLAERGRIDVLVNNAAILHLGSIEHTSLDQFRRVLDVNAAGAFAGIRAVAPAMAAQGSGSIVNISSVDGMIGMNGVTAYSASKWAMRGLARSAALELGRSGIRVNTICPAGGNTAMYEPWADQMATLGDDVLAYINNRAIPREANLSEIADAAVYLASDLSRFVTGIDLPVDGGLVAGTFLAPFNDL